MAIRHLSLGLAAAGLTVAATQAYAVPISVFNTGVDSSGALLPDGAADPHYTVNAATAFAVKSNTFPLPGGGGPWAANTSSSRWIAPHADESHDSALGTFTFHTTFNLSGLDPKSAVLHVQWASDDSSTILLNGKSTGTLSAPNFQLGSADLTSGFASGTNTLDFVVQNFIAGTPSATGLQAIVSGSANPQGGAAIPEPASLALLGLSLAPLALRLRRR